MTEETSKLKSCSSAPSLLTLGSCRFEGVCLLKWRCQAPWGCPLCSQLAGAGAGAWLAAFHSSKSSTCSSPVVTPRWLGASGVAVVDSFVYFHRGGWLSSLSKIWAFRYQKGIRSTICFRPPDGGVNHTCPSAGCGAGTGMGYWPFCPREWEGWLGASCPPCFGPVLLLGEVLTLAPAPALATASSQQSLPDSGGI